MFLTLKPQRGRREKGQWSSPGERLIDRGKPPSLFDELKALPVEEALLQIISQSTISKTIIKLIEWLDGPDHYMLILERPLDSFLQDYDDYVTGDMA
ncbi:hypothetical protein AOLI_G00037280 [Acnodon oligacanthus]